MVEEKDSIAARGVHLNAAEGSHDEVTSPLFLVSVDSNGDESVYFSINCKVLILEE
jgi:hypothetical protein